MIGQFEHGSWNWMGYAHSTSDKQKGPTVKEQQSCSNVILKVTYQRWHQDVEKRTIKMKETQGPNKSRSGKQNLEISESKLHVLKYL